MRARFLYKLSSLEISYMIYNVERKVLLFFVMQEEGSDAGRGVQAQWKL